MNLSYKWLADLVKIEAAPDDLAEMLTNAGCTVEEVTPVKGTTDTLIVAEVTTNRPDWLGHYGVAREIAALTGGEVKTPDLSLVENGPAVESLTSVTIDEDAREWCPRYTARVIQGVTIKESPAWLQDRLRAIGQRPINNVVDISNYVMFEMNQPLHAFDYDLLAENRIHIRRAKAQEPFQAITGEAGMLTPEMLVIADGEHPVALAGVKGGTTTEVSETTVNILLEAAFFQPQQVRRTSKATRMASDSSYRFERRVDPGAVERVSARAASLILELAGGTLATGVIDTAPDCGGSWEVSLRYARLKKLLGVEIPREEVASVLRGLGLDIVRDEETEIVVSVPSFRQDLTREVDLIEEVLRTVGCARIPNRISLPMQRSQTPPQVSANLLAREILVGLGYHECLCDSFVAESWEQAGHPWCHAHAHRVLNPINSERPLLRTSLVPSLLDVRRVNRDENEARLFEINRVYFDTSPATEAIYLTILDDLGTAYVRGAFEAVWAALRTAGDLTLSTDLDAGEGFAAGNCALLKNAATDGDGKPTAIFGVVSDSVTATHDLQLSPAVLECDFSKIAVQPRSRASFVPLPRFPAVKRDINLLLPEAVRWQELEKLILVKPERLEAVSYVGTFRGKGIPAGFKAVHFRLLFRDAERSLRDEEANAAHDAILGRLLAAFPGAEQR